MLFDLTTPSVLTLSGGTLELNTSGSTTVSILSEGELAAGEYPLIGWSGEETLDLARLNLEMNGNGVLRLDDHQLTLVVQPIPEPLLTPLLGLGLLLVSRQRQRR